MQHGAFRGTGEQVTALTVLPPTDDSDASVAGVVRRALREFGAGTAGGASRVRAFVGVPAIRHRPPSGLSALAYLSASIRLSLYIYHPLPVSCWITPGDCSTSQGLRPPRPLVDTPHPRETASAWPARSCPGIDSPRPLTPCRRDRPRPGASEAAAPGSVARLTRASPVLPEPAGTIPKTAECC